MYSSKEFNQENNKQVSFISIPKPPRQIQHYNWPGNVRELRTAIEHGVVMSNGTSIESKPSPFQYSIRSLPSYPVAVITP